MTCAGPNVEPDLDVKRFEMARARLGLAGWGLLRLPDPEGGYLAHRWAYTRRLADLDAVEHALDALVPERGQ